MKRRCQKTDNGGVLFECPGCGHLHCVYVEEPSPTGSRWTWNGSLELPTFSPSILVRSNYTSIHRMDDVCHSFVREGKIEFLSDCTHELAGQTVDLPVLNDEEFER